MARMVFFLAGVEGDLDRRRATKWFCTLSPGATTDSGRRFRGTLTLVPRNLPCVSLVPLSATSGIYGGTLVFFVGGGSGDKAAGRGLSLLRNGRSDDPSRSRALINDEWLKNCQLPFPHEE